MGIITTKFRNIVIDHPAQLTHKLGFLFIEYNNKTAQVPLNDINAVILINKSATITADTLSNLIYHHVLIIGCDGRCLPSSITLPICGRQSLRTAKDQFHFPKRLKARLWQKIIKRKILNQGLCLKLNNKPQYKLLTYLVHLVKPYDKTHIEAYAAKEYFKALFGKHFCRRSTGFTNSALNYGYSLIRSMLARSIIVNSMLPFLGIWHNNQFDTFALADDLIEPFRAIVDNFVINSVIKSHRISRLSKTDKQTLLKILTITVLIDNKNILINQAINLEVSSIRQCILRNTSSLLVLPALKLK